jgi:nucleotide-binding universal stress UspA family protein
MSVTDSKTEPLKRTSSPSAQPLASGPASNPYRILAVVDGTERTNRVVEFITSLAARRTAIEVVVLNVQSKRHDHRLRGYQTFKRGDIDDRLINEIGMPIVASVSRRLDKLGVPAQSRVEIGEPVDVILKCAAEEHCDAVVIGEEGPDALRRFLARTFGIVSGAVAKLAVLSPTPLIVVK